MTIGAVVKSLREERSLTQGELAQRSGVSQQVISKLETDKTDRVSAVVLARLARYLGVSTEFILDRAGVLPALQEADERQEILDHFVALAKSDEDVWGIAEYVTLANKDDWGYVQRYLWYVVTSSESEDLPNNNTRSDSSQER